MVEGLKAIPIDQFPEEAWSLVLGSPSHGGKLSPLEAYKRVGLVYRAVDIRAKALAAFPYTLERAGKDLSTDDSTLPIRRNLKNVFYRTEASLCLWGASYALRLSQELRWLQTQTIKPVYDPNAKDGVKEWKRKIGNTEKPIKYEDVIYVWLPSIEVEIGPGAAPVPAALRAAGVLDNLDSYLAGYFERGAIKATLLIVEGNPDKKEKDKLEAWWKQMISGVKSAFQTVALRSNVKPIVIGDGLKETVNKDLSLQERDSVLSTMGVPISLVFSNAANFATAQQDSLNFYDNTMVAQSELVEAPIADWAKSMGYAFRFRPERLEAYQTRKLAKAEALSKISGPQPLMSRDEARQDLDLEAWDKVNPPEEPPPMAQGPGGPGSAGPEAQAQDAAPGAPPAPGPAQEAQAAQAAASARALDLDKWRRKAIKRWEAGRAGVAPFESDAIPLAELVEIRGMLAMAQGPEDVEQVFKAREEEELSDQERELSIAIKAALLPFLGPILEAILAGREPELSTLPAALSAAMVPHMAETMGAAVASMAGIVGGPPADPAMVAAAALEWLDQYIPPLVGSITQHTRAIVERSINTFRSTPGMTREHVELLLRETFGERRAELIAITESTRAQAQATNFYKRYLADNGIAMERVWRTAADDLVCRICGPLNGKGESDWAETYPDGPPAHVRCRCGSTLRLARGSA